MYYLIETGNEPKQLTKEQMSFFYYITNEKQVKELIESLQLVSEITIFDSNRPIDKEEKEALSSMDILKKNLQTLIE